MLLLVLIGDIGGIGFNSGRQSRAAKIQLFVYLQSAPVQLATVG